MTDIVAQPADLVTRAALALVADLMLSLQQRSAAAISAEAVRPCPPVGTDKTAVRHYQADDSIFLGHDYLIKGVAGAILWKILREHQQTGRVEFTNRELRCDPALRLPRYAENLECRLILLRRRLQERRGAIRIETSGRGRFRLIVSGTLVLEEAGTP